MGKHLIVGGAGFIGCHLTKRLLEEGKEVIVAENLSRLGSVQNLRWLQAQGEFRFVRCDIRSDAEVRKIFQENRDIDVVYHLAAQVAVTRSVHAPREDFETNLLGTFNLLEAIRQTRSEPVLIYASTNKVYGRMDDIEVVQKQKRYEFKDLPEGITERVPLDLYSPYGCSKGAADQYVRDYARIYGVRSVVMRQSCIYGHRQFGVEDQGWVAWFTIASVLDRPINIYGNGKQVRDLLFIDDLIDVYLLSVEKISEVYGEIYNIGGGPENTLSLLELIDLLEELSAKNTRYSLKDWRPGDQPVFVCDIRKAKSDFGWRPKIGVREGVKRVYEWVEENKSLLRELESERSAS